MVTNGIKVTKSENHLIFEDDFGTTLQFDISVDCCETVDWLVGVSVPESGSWISDPPYKANTINGYYFVYHDYPDNEHKCAKGLPPTWLDVGSSNQSKSVKFRITNGVDELAIYLRVTADVCYSTHEYILSRVDDFVLVGEIETE